MKSKMALAWFLVALALGAFLIVQSREKAAQQQLTEKLQLKVEKLSQEARAAEQRVEELRKERALLRDDLLAAEMNNAATSANSNPAQPATNTAQASRPSPSKSSNPANLISQMMNDPEMRKVIAEQQKMGINMMYSKLIEDLGLTPEQATEFKSLLLETQMDATASSTALMDPSATNRTERIRELADQQKTQQEKIRDFLGDEKFQQYQDYSQTVGERMMLSQFGQQTKLEPDQMEDLLQIVAEEKRAAQAANPALGDPAQNMAQYMENPELMDELFAQQETVNSHVLERARSLLSPDQFQAYAAFQTNQLNMQRMGLKMAQKMMAPQNEDQPAELQPNN